MRRLFAAALTLLLALGLGVPALALEDAYVVTNPYELVEWTGENAWSAYKANLHTHTTFSDGTDDLKSMVGAYYTQGYDVLAIADHGVVGKPWDQKPQTVFPLNVANIGKSQEVLSSERLAEMTTGSDRGGRGMLQVPLGIELQAATVFKSHLVGLFGGWGQGYIGLSTDYRTSVAGTQDAGGVTIIAHPGDWLGSEFNPDAARDPANVHYFAGIMRDYESCLGIEVYNGSDGTTRHDRILWDQLLMRLMPEVNVWGFANDDSHNVGDIGRTATMLLMPRNTIYNVRTCIERGAFLACSRRDRVLGIEVSDRTLPFPGITNITIGDTSITIDVDENTTKIEWIADGKILDQTGPTVDLTHEDITCYVRAQLTGPGGITTTQPFGVDKGNGYKHPDDAPQGWAKIQWTLNLYLTKNVFGWLAENIAKLFN